MFSYRSILSRLELGLRQACWRCKRTAGSGHLRPSEPLSISSTQSQGSGSRISRHQCSFFLWPCIILTPVWLYQCSSLNPTLGAAGAKRRYGKVVKSYAAAYVDTLCQFDVSVREGQYPSLRRRVCGSLIPPDRNML